MNKLRWGILSTGNIAKKFAAGVAHSKTGALVAVGSRAQASADAFAAQFNIPRRHANYEALLADDNVDAIYIGAPHPLHAEWAIRALEAGKHVLVEKPMGINFPQAMAVVEAARKHDRCLMEGYMYRLHPQTRKLIELIGEKVVGDVRVIYASFGFRARFNADGRIFNNALAGGGILDVGGYPVSAARLMAGAAVGAPFAEPVKVHGAGKLNATTHVDEHAVLELEFASGIVAQLACAITVNLDNVIRVFGTAGKLTVTWPWTPAREGGTHDIVVERDGESPRTIKVSTDEWLYGIEADAFAASVEKRQSDELSWAFSLGNLRVMDQWRAAIGLVYDEEKPDAPEMKLNVARRTPHAPGAARGEMKYGRIAGLSKPASRLVMGVDNQDTLAHMSVMLDDFVERGGNVFDTAHIYGGGRQEAIFGQWLHNRGATNSNVREQIVLIGKGAHTPFCTPEWLSKQLLVSLERLRADYLDVYFMHRDNPAVPVGEFVDVLNEHARAGRIRVFGGSNWSRERMDAANAYAAQHKLQGLAAISNNFSLARMIEPPWAGCISASAPEFRQWLTDTQTPLFAWSSQARGFFLPHVTPDFTGDEEVRRCWFSDDNFERKRRATELAAKRGVQAINVALAYVLAQPFSTFPLIGPRALAETRSSFDALKVELSDDDVAWLDLRRD